MRDRRWWAVVAAVVVVLAGGVWWRFAPRGLVVETAVVTRATVEEVLVEEGRTRARWHLDLAAPVSGAWAPGSLVVGDSVTAGMPVGVLTAAAADPATARQVVAQVGAAEATVEAARAVERAALTAALESGRSAARVERLGPVGGMSPQALDEARAIADARQREYEAARARVTAAVFARDAARAMLPGASAPVIVRAPTAGVILRIDEEHPRVVPAGSPLLMLGAFGWPDIVVDVLSRDAPRIPARASMRVLSGSDTLLARVRRVEPTARTIRSALGVDEQRVQVIGEVLRAPRTLGHDFAV
ncbi:MAG: HlyD family efflux transporter periplasmic adaptor subunit, partial [Gemmatimonadaceae bacterium]